MLGRLMKVVQSLKVRELVGKMWTATCGQMDGWMMGSEQ